MTVQWDLRDVTLVSVTGVKADAARAAMQQCMVGLTFGRAVLISSEAPRSPDPRIEHVAIGPMDYHGYSAFILKELHKHIETSHALIVQADGFVLNPGRWNSAWLELDYIGAPFPQSVHMGLKKVQMTNRVGNGGFSLRSRRILEMTAPIDLATLRYPTRNEDMIVCHLLHDYLTGKGARFADVESAQAFSIGRPSQITEAHNLRTAFGFHGKDVMELLDIEGRQSLM